MMTKHNEKTGCNSDITLLKFPTLLIKIRNCNAYLPYIINNIIRPVRLSLIAYSMSNADVIAPCCQLIVVNIPRRFVLDEPYAPCLEPPSRSLDDSSAYCLTLKKFA